MEKEKYYTPTIEEFYFKYYLYRHITSDSRIPFYIGIGKKHSYSNTFESEYKRAFSKKRSNYWHNIVNKHGVKVQILFESNNKDEILIKESEFINLYGRRDLKTGILCNMTSGGEFPSNLTPEKEVIRRNKIKAYGKTRIWEESTKKKISESKMKKISKFTLDGLWVEDFNSVSKAAESIKLTISSISKCLKNEKYTAGGYKWKLKSI
jgi:hypothetical protein